MQVTAQEMHDLEAGFPMFTQKPQQIFAFYEHDLRSVNGFRCYLVWLAGKCGTQPKHFAWPSNTQHESLAVLGADGKLGATVTQDEDSPRLAPFGEKRGPSRAETYALNGVKGL
jgi:hypothetical protein